MRSLSRALARWDGLRVAALVLGVVWLGLLGAFAFGVASPGSSTGALVAAVASLPIAGAGFMYAWRNPAPFDL
jgi:hypothetical protein